MSNSGAQDIDLSTCPVGQLILKISDFGHARSFDGSASSSHTLTTRGSLMFMAPEVRRAMFEGSSSASYHKSADVWSMAMVALYMVTGTVPSKLVNFSEAYFRDLGPYTLLYVYDFFLFLIICYFGDVVLNSLSLS